MNIKVISLVGVLCLLCLPSVVHPLGLDIISDLLKDGPDSDLPNGGPVGPGLSELVAIAEGILRKYGITKTYADIVDLDTGILAIASGILNANGGTIGAQSKLVGNSPSKTALFSAPDVDPYALAAVEQGLSDLSFSASTSTSSSSSPTGPHINSVVFMKNGLIHIFTFGVNIVINPLAINLQLKFEWNPPAATAKVTVTYNLLLISVSTTYSLTYAATITF